MERCVETHVSKSKGVTTVVRCDRSVAHGANHESVIAWYAAPTENWQPGDVVRDKHERIFYRTLCNHWYRPGLSGSFDDDYPTRPLIKLVPEQTP